MPPATVNSTYVSHARYSVQPERMGGSGKAEGSAQALPMADGPTIGKLTLAAATRNPSFQGRRRTAA